MKPYQAVFQAHFRSLLQYRAAALAGMGTQVFWGLLRVMIFTAFYRSTGTTQPMALSQTITYLWLTQALLLLLPWHPDPSVEEMVHTGNVAYELTKPVDLYNLWYARSVAQRTAPILLRCPLVAATALLLFGMRAPASVTSAVLFGLSIVGAVMLGASITVLLTLSLLWTLSSRGVVTVSTACVNLFSGALVPLQLFPDWAQSTLDGLPFRGLLDTPFRLYLGTLAGHAAALALAHQFGWALLLMLMGRLLLGTAQRRIVVQGG